FTAPRWAASGKKIRNAHITSWVNGVKVQDDVSLPTKTGNGQQESPTLLPTNLQNHKDPVRFRNVWVIDRGLTQAEFPVTSSEESRQNAAKLEWESEADAQ
ncbi:MAG: family 16 glycoside hydrolase, partial [Planctomycetota bacterium]